MRGLAEEEDEARRELRRRKRERERDSWFTCRHGNAASPLTCYSIGIARPSAAVLSQPPQEYERESRSIAWDRERADASFPMGERSLASEARSLCLAEDLFFFSRRRDKAGGKRERVSRTRGRDTVTLAHNTHYRNYHRRNTHSTAGYLYILYTCGTCTLAVLSLLFPLFHPRRNVEFRTYHRNAEVGKE